MSKQTFDDKCPGCRPVLLDPKTMKPLPDDDPIMQTINMVWEAITLPEREAFHRVTCLNSRAPEDLRIVFALNKKMEEACKFFGTQ